MTPLGGGPGGRVVASAAGAAWSGAAGFALVTVITHGLPVADAGAVLTGIALATVLAAACCAGADTGMIWLLPRLGAPGDRRAGVRSATGRTVVLSAVAAVVLVVVACWGAGVLPGTHGTAVLVVVAAVLPVLVASTVLVATVRGLDRLPLYIALQFGVLPTGRLVGVALALAVGGGVAAALAGWGAAAAVTLVVAALAARALTAGTGSGARARARVVRSLWRFCRPRAVSSVIDASAGWVGVLLVSVLAGAAAAARFGAVSRCALAGLLVMQAVRVATGAQFSALLREDDVAAAGRLYRASTRWIVAVSWPFFGLVAAYPVTVLGVFGREYRSAAAALVVVVAAMAVNTACGNAQTVLLMSGDSRRHLLATVSGLATTVVGDVALVPHLGVLAAAAAWAAGIVVENALVLGWVVRRVGVAPLDRASVVLLAVLLGAVAPALVTVRWAAGPGWASLVLAGATSVAVLGLCLGGAWRLRAPGAQAVAVSGARRSLRG